MRSIIVLVLLILFSSYQGSKFYRVKVNKEISLLLSTDFIAVPPEEIASKFISYRSPLAVYTNMNTDIEFGINTSVLLWRNSDIELMKSFYKSNIASLYDEVEFLREENKLINQREFVIFEFISKINPEDKSAIIDAPVAKYTYIQYSIVKGTVYVFDFSSPADQMNMWKPVIVKMMESVKIK